MKKMILLYILCITYTAHTAHEVKTTIDLSITQNNRVKKQITLAKLHTYFIKNPNQNLILTMMLSFLSSYPIKNILKYMDHDIIVQRIDDPFHKDFAIDLKLSHIAPFILFFSKLFYDSYQTKKYIARQDALIAKLKKSICP